MYLACVLWPAFEVEPSTVEDGAGAVPSVFVTGCSPAGGALEVATVATPLAICPATICIKLCIKSGGGEAPQGNIPALILPI